MQFLKEIYNRNVILANLGTASLLCYFSEHRATQATSLFALLYFSWVSFTIIQALWQLPFWKG